MAVFGAGGWFGSLFFRPAHHVAKLTEPTPEGGAAIGPDRALQIGAVWACIRLLAETIGTLPLQVYSRGAGGRAIDDGHPLYALLHDSPNADMTAAEFWEAIVASLCQWGNGYAEKVTAAGGRVIALNFLRPELMMVERDRSGARVYRYSDPKGMRLFGEDAVFHVRGFGVGGDMGLSPVGYARQTLGLVADTDRAASAAFRNGIRPSGFLVVPERSSPEAIRNARKVYLEPIAGPNATGRAGILEKGMDWKEVKGMPVADMQLLQGRSFNVEEICRWFRVPPFMIGHTEKSTSWGTGLEQQMLAFVTFSLRPYLTRIEQAIRKQLLPPGERRTIYAEFSVEGLLRADSQGRAALLAALAQNGFLTRNEGRAYDNRPPLPGGDVLTVQSNLVPLDQLGAPAAAAGEKAALARVLGLEEMVAAAVRAALAGHNGGPPPEGA